MAQQAVAQPVPPLPAPIKGWNTRDALTAMDPLDAVELDNFYPDNSGVTVRNGYVVYATGVGSTAVATLAEYFAGSVRKLLAASSGGIYDISVSGAAGAPLASGFGSNNWQTVAFLSRLFFANGVDTMQVFNGTTVVDATFTGVTLSTLVGGVQYQQRLFFWQNNSTGFWFAPLNSISGALSFYDLAAFAPHGGNLVAAVTFSHDGGNGVLDMIAFIMSSGDCLLYFGNDPSIKENWQLVGIYRISPPVSPRAVCQYGAEAFLTTYDDHVPLEQQLQALQRGQLPVRSKVSGAVQAAVIANPAGFGWQALYYPRGRRLIFNVPNPDGTFDQHIQNTGLQYQDDKTGQVESPWCRFKNMNASTFGLFKDSLYFGAAGGIVYQADTGSLDVLGAVNGFGQQAWNDFTLPQRKNVKAARPIFQGVGSVAVNFKIGFDYGAINIGNVIAIVNAGSPWDTSPWDTSPWSAESTISTQWRASAGSGTAAGISVTTAANNKVTWLRTDLRGELGQGL
jgi:hypothetical protein